MLSFRMEANRRHLVQSMRLGLCDLWESLRGWGGGDERWPLPFFFFFSSLSLSLSPSLSETGPARALWLRAFRRLLLKSWCSGTLSQAWAEWLFSHQWCNPATALLGPTVATRRRSQPPAICPPQSHAPGGGGGGNTTPTPHTSSLRTPEALR